MKILKETISLQEQGGKKYKRSDLVQAVILELEEYLINAEGELPDLSEMLDMLHDNRGIQAALSDHPQHEILINIIEKALNAHSDDDSDF